MRRRDDIATRAEERAGVRTDGKVDDGQGAARLSGGETPGRAACAVGAQDVCGERRRGGVGEVERYDICVHGDCIRYGSPGPTSVCVSVLYAREMFWYVQGTRRMGRQREAALTSDLLTMVMIVQIWKH